MSSEEVVDEDMEGFVVIFLALVIGGEKIDVRRARLGMTDD